MAEKREGFTLNVKFLFKLLCIQSSVISQKHTENDKLKRRRKKLRESEKWQGLKCFENSILQEELHAKRLKLTETILNFEEFGELAEA